MTTSEDGVEIPSYADLMYPTLQALDFLAGEGSKHEIDETVIKQLELTAGQLAVEYPEDAQQTGSKIVHRLAWARSYLKKLGAIESQGRGVWGLTSEGRHLLGLGELEVRHREHELRVGKRPDAFLKHVAQEIEDTPRRMTVRDLIAEWGVRRRGAAVVARISRDLAQVGMTTEPAFDSVPLGGAIELRPVAKTVEPSTHPDASDDGPPPSMTVTIGTLEPASGGVTSVSPEEPILRAQSLMERYEYSQLAVLAGERTLKGAISWESIARAALYRGQPSLVRDAIDSGAVVVNGTDPLLEHVGTIADAGYVFVRDATNRIKGIVTAADLSVEFAKQANPFLLLGEIEGWLRQIVDAEFSADDLAGYVDPDDPDRQIEAASSLTFGEYVRLLQSPEAWDRLGLVADRAIFVDHLDEVRRVRNSIMHFSPDPLDESELSAIDSLLSWVRTLARNRMGP